MWKIYAPNVTHMDRGKYLKKRYFGITFDVIALEFTPFICESISGLIFLIIHICTNLQVLVIFYYITSYIFIIPHFCEYNTNLRAQTDQPKLN